MTEPTFTLQGKPLEELSRPELIAAFPQLVKIFCSENEEARNTAFHLIKQLYQMVDIGVLQNALITIGERLTTYSQQPGCEADEIASLYSLAIEMIGNRLSEEG